ncbi:MAG: EamA family transporter [Actinomycetota bacterium]|nr:EamA family transporter [Actinomycetota bacterium]MDZ4178195.1 EamA family transporter [Coriobacteriia bacterium]
MLTVLLATSTSVLFGAADFLGGLASRRDSAVAVTARAHTVGVPLFALSVLFMPPLLWGGGDIGWGIVAGVAGGIGVVSLYAALGIGRMSVVAPITAALAGSLPAVYDLARGASLGPVSLTGLALALIATVIVSVAPGPADEERPVTPLAVAFACAAGTGFAASFISFSFTGVDSGWLPLLVARVTSAGLLTVLTLSMRRTISLDPSARTPAIGAGLLETAANVTMLTAIRIGPLAVASVLGSLFPVVVIVLARFFLGERLMWMQRGGVALALLAVILTAMP